MQTRIWAAFLIAMAINTVASTATTYYLTTQFLNL